MKLVKFVETEFEKGDIVAFRSNSTESGIEIGVIVDAELDGEDSVLYSVKSCTDEIELWEEDMLEVMAKSEYKDIISDLGEDDDEKD